jgi:radical SAM superfamily enzyme YgiQ (UPF0313 family)
VKVLLIYPCEMSVYRGTRFEFKQTQECLPPLNIAVLAGSLRSAGHDVSALDLQVEGDQEAAIRGAVSSWRPDLVGISFKTPLYNQARQIAALVRRVAPAALIVGGGVHATNYPELCLAETEMDVIVIGEGDYTIIRLADAVPLSQIEGIAYKQDGRIVLNRNVKENAHTGSQEHFRDLDSLPYPDWEVFDLARYSGISRLFYDATPVGFIETSRGCPGRCVFCSKGVYNSAWRRKSPQRVVDEMQRMLAYGFREIEIVDDAFTTDLDRAVAVCQEILRRRLRFPWCCRNGLRVSDVTPEFFRIARKAGLHLVAFGFETGNAALLAEMKKGATLERGRQAARWASQAGITVMGYFLMGLPGETEQTLRETIDFACSLDIDFVKYNLAMPLPGTGLHEMWKDRLNVTNWEQYSLHLPARNLYEHPTLDWDTLEASLRAGYRRFYLRPGYLLGQLVRMLRQRRFLISAKTALQLLLGPREKRLTTAASSSSGGLPP